MWMYVTLNLMLTLVICYGNVLRMVLEPRSVNCMFVEAKKGAPIDVKVLLSYGLRGDVGVKVIKPTVSRSRQQKIQIWKEDNYFLDFELKAEAEEDGDYEFCIFNNKKLEKRIVDFEYGRHEDNIASIYKEELKTEYDERFYNKFLSTQKLFKDLNNPETNENYQKAYDRMTVFEKALNITLSPVKRSLFLIRERMGNLGRYLDYKRTESRRDFNLMKSNLWRVDYYSLGFCVMMVLVSYFQIVTIRSMFMEKITLNIWSRYTTK